MEFVRQRQPGLQQLDRHQPAVLLGDRQQRHLRQYQHRRADRQLGRHPNHPQQHDLPAGGRCGADQQRRHQCAAVQQHHPGQRRLRHRGGDGRVAGAVGLQPVLDTGRWRLCRAVGRCAEADAGRLAQRQRQGRQQRIRRPEVPRHRWRRQHPWRERAGGRQRFRRQLRPARQFGGHRLGQHVPGARHRHRRPGPPR